MVSTRWTIQYGNDSADQNRFHRHRYIIYSSLVSLVSGRKSTTYTGTSYAMYEDGTANAVMSLSRMCRKHSAIPKQIGYSPASGSGRIPGFFLPSSLASFDGDTPLHRSFADPGHWSCAAGGPQPRGGDLVRLLGLGAHAYASTDRYRCLACQNTGLSVSEPIERPHDLLLGWSKLHRNFAVQWLAHQVSAYSVGAPTFEIDGIKMLPSLRVSPFEDARRKVALVRPQGKTVLDTCGGLGYFAACCLEAGAIHIRSFEKNPDVLWLRTLNPWSPNPQAIQANQRLELVGGDIEQAIEDLPDASVDAIVHDPPRFSIAGELYALRFYDQLARVLCRGGQMFHYTGSPTQLSHGRDVPREIARRLEQAGFQSTLILDGVLAQRR